MSNHTDPTGRTSPIVPGDLFARHQTITGLRALADFLEANPGVPVNTYGETFHVPIRAADDASAVALVDQTAALLGVNAQHDTRRGGHYLATRTFGRIAYTVFHIPEQQWAASLARDSYRDNIRLDHHDQGDDSDTGRVA
ncbi:hypothetical protein FHX41_0411 [Actinomadura hallensis]|uniref:Uncharacterized protein n=1 Tax=Actinomadura hallensis TaxID=337895 RepID=A0A543I892_9ACTN|nr:hypothetical protein [Actinomadura hallensis]TQM66822.1 hypothetical protein FHX41_0411 [Actinomadura hallensis]